MKLTKKILSVLFAAVLVLSLGACSFSGSDESETEEETIQTEAEYTFEVTDGPSVNIVIDMTDGYALYVSPDIVVIEGETEETEASEDEEDDPADDIDFEGADFVITCGSDMIYGSFRTVSETTIAELFYYPSYETLEIGSYSGFYVQGSDDEYDLLLEIQDKLYICLCAYDESVDLKAAAERLTITTGTDSEEESSAEE